MKLQRLHLNCFKVIEDIEVLKVTVVHENFERVKVDVEEQVGCV